jgi:hypothetical protein
MKGEYLFTNQCHEAYVKGRSQGLSRSNVKVTRTVLLDIKSNRRWACDSFSSPRAVVRLVSDKCFWYSRIKIDDWAFFGSVKLEATLAFVVMSDQYLVKVVVVIVFSLPIFTLRILNQIFTDEINSGCIWWDVSLFQDSGYLELLELSEFCMRVSECLSRAVIHGHFFSRCESHPLLLNNAYSVMDNK